MFRTDATPSILSSVSGIVGSWKSQWRCGTSEIVDSIRIRRSFSDAQIPGRRVHHGLYSAVRVVVDVRKLRHNLGGGKNSGSTAGCIREQYPCLVVVIVVVLTIINQIRSNVGKALLQLNPETRPVIFPQHTPYGHTKYAPNHAHTMRGKIRCLPASSRRISLHTSTSSTSRYLWRLPNCQSGVNFPCCWPILTPNRTEELTLCSSRVFSRSYYRQDTPAQTG